MRSDGTAQNYPKLGPGGQPPHPRCPRSEVRVDVAGAETELAAMDTAAGAVAILSVRDTEADVASLQCAVLHMKQMWRPCNVPCFISFPLVANKTSCCALFPFRCQLNLAVLSRTCSSSISSWSRPHEIAFPMLPDRRPLSLALFDPPTVVTAPSRTRP